MPVAAMRARNPVCLREVIADAHRDGLLPHIEMYRPWQLRGERGVAEHFLDLPDEQHLAVEGELLVDPENGLLARHKTLRAG